MVVPFLSKIAFVFLTSLAAKSAAEEIDDILLNAYLFDADTDPLEQNNIIDEIVLADVVEELQTRFDYFRSINVSIEPQDLEGLKQGWQLAGGVVPLGDMPEKEIMSTGEPLDDAPNIVFILLDDVGLNDVNLDHQSTWLSFATPNIDKIASQGIVLTNHFAAWVCGPSRASFMTGRYPYRMGYGEVPGIGEVNLPLSESTVAEELRFYGYRTVLIGKWHLGFQDWKYTPTFRGFDRFYGYYMGSIGYFSKLTQSGFLDLHDDEALVADEDELDSSTTHLTTLLQAKAEEAIVDHVENYPGTRLFLYYAMENVHTGSSQTGEGAFEAPEEFMELCTSDFKAADFDLNLEAYCALVVMMDAAIGDTVCALESADLADNTVMVVASDNGGSKIVPGSTFPYRGFKGAYGQGGVKAAAFLYAPSFVAESAWGSEYTGLVHISDWFPTFLGLASGGTFSGTPLSGHEIDGYDVFEAIVSNTSSPRNEIFVNWDEAKGYGAMQLGSYRMVVGRLPNPYINDVNQPNVSFYANSYPLETDFTSTCLAYWPTSVL